MCSADLSGGNAAQRATLCEIFHRTRMASLRHAAAEGTPSGAAPVRQKSTIAEVQPRRMRSSRTARPR